MKNEKKKDLEKINKDWKVKVYNENRKLKNGGKMKDPYVL